MSCKTTFLISVNSCKTKILLDSTILLKVNPNYLNPSLPTWCMIMFCQHNNFTSSNSFNCKMNPRRKAVGVIKSILTHASSKLVIKTQALSLFKIKTLTKTIHFQTSSINNRLLSWLSNISKSKHTIKTPISERTTMKAYRKCPLSSCPIPHRIRTQRT